MVEGEFPHNNRPPQGSNSAESQENLNQGQGNQNQETPREENIPNEVGGGENLPAQEETQQDQEGQQDEQNQNNTYAEAGEDILNINREDLEGESQSNQQEETNQQTEEAQQEEIEQTTPEAAALQETLQRLEEQLRNLREENNRLREEIRQISKEREGGGNGREGGEEERSEEEGGGNGREGGEEERSEEERRADATEQFLSICEVFEELRRRDIEHRYGKGTLARMRAWLAGEYDFRLTQGRLERDNLTFLARKALVTIFNRRTLLGGAALAAVGIFTGGVGIPALYALGGGTLGNAIGELWQTASKNNPETARRELYQQYLASITTTFTRLSEEIRLLGREIGPLTSSPESIPRKYLEAVINEVYKATREKIKEKHQTILDLEHLWNRRKGLLYAVGALVGGAFGAWQAYQTRIESLGELRQTIQDLGWHDYDGDGIFHQVVKVGDQLYYKLIPHDWAVAQAHGWPLHGFNISGLEGLWHQMYPGQPLPSAEALKGFSEVVRHIDWRFLAPLAGTLSLAAPRGEVAQLPEITPYPPLPEIFDIEKQTIHPCKAMEGESLPELTANQRYMIAIRDKEGNLQNIIIEYTGEQEELDGNQYIRVKRIVNGQPRGLPFLIPQNEIGRMARVEIERQRLGEKEYRDHLGREIALQIEGHYIILDLEGREERRGRIEGELQEQPLQIGGETIEVGDIREYTREGIEGVCAIEYQGQDSEGRGVFRIRVFENEEAFRNELRRRQE